MVFMTDGRVITGGLPDPLDQKAAMTFEDEAAQVNDPDEDFVDGVPDGDDIPDENDDPNANRNVDIEDDKT